MRLIYTEDIPRDFAIPPLGVVQKDDIVDILDKDQISSLQEKGFIKAPPFEGATEEGTK